MKIKYFVSLLLSVLLLTVLLSCHSQYKSQTNSKINNTESLETNDIPSYTDAGEETTEETTGLETDNNNSSQTDETQAMTETTVKDEKHEYTVEELAEVLHLSSTMVSVLSNEAKLRDTNPLWKDDEFVYLQYFVRYNFNKRSFARAFDLDEDGINEVVILDGGLTTVVLREYEGTVYGRGLGFRDMYNLRIDGTYDWDGREEDVLTYATSKLNFNGADWNPIELDRIDDIDDNLRYYIGGTEVTEEEYKAYKQSEELAEKAEWYILILKFETGV